MRLLYVLRKCNNIIMFQLDYITVAPEGPNTKTSQETQQHLLKRNFEIGFVVVQGTQKSFFSLFFANVVFL